MTERIGGTLTGHTKPRTVRHLVRKTKRNNHLQRKQQGHMLLQRSQRVRNQQRRKQQERKQMLSKLQRHRPKLHKLKLSKQTPSKPTLHRPKPRKPQPRTQPRTQPLHIWRVSWLACALCVLRVLWRVQMMNMNCLKNSHRMGHLLLQVRPLWQRLGRLQPSTFSLKTSN
ncbi:MAG: hypothetical protein AAGL10_01645 [Pseudomonadota bacterium]